MSLQERPYQWPDRQKAASKIKALRGPKLNAPASTRTSVLHLCKCSRCQRRPSNAASRLRERVSKGKLAAAELNGILRRLEYQCAFPGGVHQLRNCLGDLLAVEADTRFWPAVSQQAVSPRFLRRLCKVYTSFDIAVDHQIRLLHLRPGVARSPFLGEAFTADRFRCEAVLSPRNESHS